jgi:hypothetical protein
LLDNGTTADDADFADIGTKTMEPLIFADPTRIPFPATEWRRKAAHCVSCGYGTEKAKAPEERLIRPITNHVSRFTLHVSHFTAKSNVNGSV